jgi:hypothetical protein
LVVVIEPLFKEPEFPDDPAATSIVPVERTPEYSCAYAIANDWILREKLAVTVFGPLARLIA